jgi:hypothetical protein
LLFALENDLDWLRYFDICGNTVDDCP